MRGSRSAIIVDERGRNSPRLCADACSGALLWRPRGAPTKLHMDGPAHVACPGVWLLQSSFKFYGLFQTGLNGLVLRVAPKGHPKLVLINPPQLTPLVKAQLQRIEAETQAKVEVILQPGDWHHFQLPAAQALFPEAVMYVASGRNLRKQPKIACNGARWARAIGARAGRRSGAPAVARLHAGRHPARPERREARRASRRGDRAPPAERNPLFHRPLLQPLDGQATQAEHERLPAGRRRRRAGERAARARREGAARRLLARTARCPAACCRPRRWPPARSTRRTNGCSTHMARPKSTRARGRQVLR